MESLRAVAPAFIEVALGCERMQGVALIIVAELEAPETEVGFVVEVARPVAAEIPGVLVERDLLNTTAGASTVFIAGFVGFGIPVFV